MQRLFQKFRNCKSILSELNSSHVKAASTGSLLNDSSVFSSVDVQSLIKSTKNIQTTFWFVQKTFKQRFGLPKYK